MTTRDRLHRLVDVLPDADADAVAPLLEALARHALATDPAALACALAPEDDEPLMTEDRVALAERAHADPGAYVPLDVALAALAARDAGAGDDGR